LIFDSKFAFALFAILLVLLLLVPLIGCGSGDINRTPTSTTTPTPVPTGNVPPVTISSPSGEVLVQKSGSGADNFVLASAGMRLEPGDRIKTGEESSTLIIFFDGSVMEIGANSDITIEQLDLAQDTGSTTIRLKQLVGNTVNRVQQLVDSASKYEVETPAGVAVVRGTIFSMMVEESGYTLLSTDDGFVWFTAGGVTVLVGPGMQTSASPGGTPSASFSIDNIEVCSDVRGERDYTVQPGAAFDSESRVWIYFEVFGFSARATGDTYEVWFRTVEARVYEPGGDLYLSGENLEDYHQTELETIPEYSWGTLSFKLLPSAPSGQYRLEAEIKDIISGEIDSFTITFSVK